MQAISKFLLGVILVALLIFLPAGTLHYPCGWLFLAVLFIPMFGAGLVMLQKNPALLQSRLDAKEKESTQQTVVKLAALMFLAGFIVAGLDFRFGWFPLPFAASGIAAAVFLFAYVLYAEVLRENTFLSRTIKVQEGQTVVDTGLYGIVRHPMYAVTVLLFLSMPFVLGSLIAFPIFLLYPFILVKRILNEEEVLKRELSGYEDYCTRVRFRLIPYIW